ncbi:glycosyltransferase [Synechococcus lacustris]|uniref:Glycosyl transferase n=1 Tax=Synechococcus lacustris str. Tous TaxID=1910958 RepID=A0A2P7EEL9_9SYNE|nr:glycosyltransferase [Synechococcus lacustris]PSI01634.1 glycosyl transferase [Synechococcus lacustris str. Tous]
MIIQLVRECPPGHGGVERVAHELAVAWHAQGKLSATISLQPYDPSADDPSLPVLYRRSYLPSIKLGRQLLLPLPSRRLWAVLTSSDELHVHLPCPGLLAVSVFARLMQPGRTIRLHWHAFLQAPRGPQGWLIGFYQLLALRWATYGVQVVVTTSPVLAEALFEEGVPRIKVFVLPCCLGELQEQLYGQIAEQRRHRQMRSQQQHLRLIFIGRLDSYKRVDWLIEACAALITAELHVIGDGSLRMQLEFQAQALGIDKAVVFHGRVSEQEKLVLLRDSDLLVLPADSSNEAFGIVQLEAMACGVPALAFDFPRSGIAWVSHLKQVLTLPCLKRQDLVAVIDKLANDSLLLDHASEAAEQRYIRVFSRAVWQARFAEVLP